MEEGKTKKKGVFSTGIALSLAGAVVNNVKSVLEILNARKVLCNHSRKSIWFLALLAAVSVVWLIVRTGAKPSRISYPCQRAAVANINIFLVALSLPLVGLTGRLLHTGIVRSRVAAAVIVSSLLVVGVVSNVGMFSTDFVPALNLAPVVLDLQSQASDIATASNLFIVEHASGSQGNMDAAISELFSSMQMGGVSFFKTTGTSSGLFGANDVIIIKVNGVGPQRAGTNTDLAKSLVKAIVAHPDGFTGEVVIADNGQDTGGINMAESNAYDHSQSMTDVAAMFPTYKVSAYSWYTLRSSSVAEYSSGNLQSGYVVNYTSNAVTGVKVSYPKFQTAYGTYISFKNGVWNQSALTYDSSRLKIINMPLFKSHYDYGATSCVKNYMGVGSQTLTSMHNSVGNGGMGTMMVETRFPTLNILDGIWINANPFQPGGSSPTPGPCGPYTTYDVASYTDLICASVDPVALEYWFAKHVAMPTAVQRGYTYISSIDPDYEPITQNLDQSYHHYLTASMNQIKNSGWQATMLESEMNVYVNELNSGCHLMLNVDPNLATYAKGESLTLGVMVLNQLNPQLETTLTLTITGPGSYSFYDFQPVNVSANAINEYSFDWSIPDLAGSYVVEIGLVPAQLTAYDTSWVKVT